MCKLAGWTSPAPLSFAHAEAAVKAAHRVIRKTEKDGFGCAQNGYRTRHLTPAHYAGLHGVQTLRTRAGKGFTGLAIATTAASEGRYNRHAGMVIHGRTATCAVTLPNVHPFALKGWRLAHNGVISWNGPETKLHAAATVDSQHLLIAIATHHSNEARRAALENITGYAAIIAIGPEGQMIVARDSTASLYAGITSRGRWLFGTTTEIVAAQADAMGAKGVVATSLDDWAWLEFTQGQRDPVVLDWHHERASTAHWSHAARSIGHAGPGHQGRFWEQTPKIEVSNTVDRFPDYEPGIPS